MKKLWIGIIFVVLLIWAISAVISAMLNPENSSPPVVAESEPPRDFKLVMEVLDRNPSPGIRSASAIVVDLADGRVLLSKNESEIRPIASLTKLATALVFLKTSPNFFQTMTVTREDKEGAGRSRLYTGETVTLNDLFHLMLICSDNVAARVIGRSSGLFPEKFVGRMNEFASSLDLEQTHFADPTGLDPGNVSTAAECSIIFKTALEDGLIREVMSKRSYSFKPINGKRIYMIHNTNRMLFGRDDIICGKTGYISESGYCLALGVECEGGRELAAVVLGAPTSGTRFRDAARLLTSINASSRAAD